LGLLDRAKQMLQGRPAAPPSRSQYYRVACVEGHVLHGQRAESYQALRCPVCNEGIFVLPRSPLPEPAVPASAKAPSPQRRAASMGDELILADPPSQAEMAQARAAQAGGMPRPVVEPVPGDEAEIEWMDEAAPTQEAPSPEPKAPRPKPAPAAAKQAARKAPVSAPPPPGMIEIEEKPSLADWARRHKNPLIFATVALVVLGTVGLRLRQQRLEELPKVVELGRTEGLSKLDLGEFTVAKTLLGEAARAANSLGGQVEGADEVRQGALEAALLADRCSEPLGEVLEKAEAFNPPDGWASYFDAIYKGKAVIIQASITAVPDPAKPGSTYDLDYRIYHGNGSNPRGKARIDLNGFRLFEQARPQVGDVVTFGARLASLRVDSIDPATGERSLQLVPDSGAFITHQRVVELIFPRNDPEGEETL
jgi:hypothetical protein